MANENFADEFGRTWKGLVELTGGLRRRKLVTLCSGTGVGKCPVYQRLVEHSLRGVMHTGNLTSGEAAFGELEHGT